MQGGNWHAQCRADLRHLLAQLESLPMSPAERTSNLGPLRALLDPPHGLFSRASVHSQPPSPVKGPLLLPAQEAAERVFPTTPEAATRSEAESASHQPAPGAQPEG